MNNFRLKLKHILLPHIYIALGAPLIHIFFYYVLVLKMEINLRDIASKYFLPGMMVIAAVFIWVSPGIERLKFKNNKATGYYYIICVASTLWLCVASANLLTLQTNNNIHVDTVFEIGSKPESIYYTINNYKLIKEYRKVSTEIIKHKHRDNRYTKINLYYVTPISGKKINDISNHKYWSVDICSIKTDYNADNTKIEKLIKDHQQLYSVDNQPIITNHFKRLLYPEGKDYIMTSIQKATQKTPEDVILLEPSYENIPDKAIYVRQIFISFLSGIILLFIFLIFPKYNIKNTNDTP